MRTDTLGRIPTWCLGWFFASFSHERARIRSWGLIRKILVVSSERQGLNESDITTPRAGKRGGCGK
jgi:hypothetical protein